jgi:hypothetical protein
MKHVTQILSAVGLRGGWSEFIPKDDREFYLQRGTMVHKSTVLHDRGILDWKTVDERIIPYVKAWKKFREETGGKIVEIECRVENRELNYCGTLDRIIRKCRLYPAGNLLIDIKTSEADQATKIQTMAYAMAQKKKVKRGFVALHNTGNYSAGIYKDDEIDKAAWLACLTLNNWIERNIK